MTGDALRTQLAEVLRTALADRCTTCWRPVATDEQWKTVAEGERDDLCWDEVACGYDVGLTEEGVLADALLPLLARARAEGAAEALRDAAGHRMNGSGGRRIGWLDEMADRYASALSAHTTEGDPS